MANENVWNGTLIDWRWVLARGIFGVLFGILALLFPAAALAAVALLFAVYVAVDGAMALSSAWSHRQQGRGWGLLAFEGVVGLIAGFLALVFPGAALLALILLMSLWAFMSGVVEIWAATSLRHHPTGSILLGLAGVASIAFGLIVLFWPVAGAAALLAIIAVYSLVFGVLLTAWSLRLRAQSRTGKTGRFQGEVHA